MAPDGTDIALGHNGNLINHVALAEEAAGHGLVDLSDHLPSDSDIMCALLAHETGLIAAERELKGLDFSAMIPELEVAK